MASDNEASCESDPNFAVICAFMEKFGTTCGLQGVDFLELQEMLENTQEVRQELIDLHIKLLRKSRKTVSNERWEKAIIKFCHTFCVQDAWEIERFGYKKARLSSKLRVLKELLEMQFDFNARFKAEINKMSAEELRSQPLGKDKHGHAYWFQNDNNCQIRVYKEDPDEETWTLVAKDRDGLASLISELSDGDSKVSSESAINEEDSNSLMEKPIIDTGQVDSSSSDSNKKTSGDSETDNNISPEEEEEEETKTKRSRESGDEEADAKRPKVEEVSEAIEEAVVVVKGEGDGEANQCVNPIVGEEIEEDPMFFYGEGDGRDCETGNEEKEGGGGDPQRTDQQQSGDGGGASDSGGLVSISDTKNCVNNEVPTSPVKSPYKLGTIIDSKTDNKFFSTVKCPTKKSRWDVETIIAKDDEEKGSSESSPKKSMFFFGPGCLQFTPATVGFGQKVPPERTETKEGDVGYRIEGEGDNNKVEYNDCVQFRPLDNELCRETPIESRIDKLDEEVNIKSDNADAAVEETKVEDDVVEEHDKSEEVAKDEEEAAAAVSDGSKEEEKTQNEETEVPVTEEVCVKKDAYVCGEETEEKEHEIVENHHQADETVEKQDVINIDENKNEESVIDSKLEDDDVDETKDKPPAEIAETTKDSDKETIKIEDKKAPDKNETELVVQISSEDVLKVEEKKANNTAAATMKRGRKNNASEVSTPRRTTRSSKNEETIELPAATRRGRQRPVQKVEKDEEGAAAEAAEADSNKKMKMSGEESGGVVVVESSNSSDVVELIDKDPLLVSDEEAKSKEKTMSLANFSLDFTESPAPTPPLTRSGLRKRGRESPQNSDDNEETGGKRPKMKAKRAVDVKLRKSIEEQKKQELASSDEEGKSKKKEEEAIVLSSDESQKKKKKKKKETQNKNKRLLSNLGIDPDRALDFDVGQTSGVRQSRRIAQLKIREEAERRKLEEEMSQETHKRKKKSKKSEDKDYKVDKKKLNDEDDEAADDDSADSKKRKKKKKKKKHKMRFDEFNPWKSSSDSSTTDEEEEEEIAEEEDDDEVLQYVSDHEFSPESDMEGDGEAQPLKRARTARKESDVEEVDDCPCQKCGKSDHPEWILLCDSCDNGWHCSCLRPPLLVIPEGDWFCPPCQHTSLLKNLQEKLQEFDKKLNKKEIEDRRKQRLAYVGISLNNVLPAKESDGAKKRRHSAKDEEDDDDDDDDDDDADEAGDEETSSEESESGSGSESGSDSDEPIYQLRQRRQAHSYRFNDYDELINSAIQEEMEAVKGAGNQGRGKDIATIVNAEKEEERKKEASLEEGNEEKEPLPPVVPLNDKDKEPKPIFGGSDDDVVQVKKKIIGRKKHRKLNSLDISDEDDEDSDEDFKGTSSESDDDFDEDLGSEDSDDLDTGRGRRRGTDQVRRSTRARTSRYDADFIDDNSDDSEDAPRRKKKRSIWDESESEESDRSWGRRKRKPAASRSKKSTSSSNSKKKKSKKKKKHNDSDEEVYKKKKPKIKFGLDGDDDGPVRRTRGKKINYVDALGSDSDDDRVKRPPPRIESDEEYVANEEEEKVSEEEAESTEENANSKAASKIQIQSYTDARFTQLLPEPKNQFFTEDAESELNPIDQINRNVEMMDENEMEKMMEEEEYANKQLQMVAQQLEKEKRRKEREAKMQQQQQQQMMAKKISARIPKDQFQFSGPMQEPLVGNVDNLLVNSENNDELSEPPGVSLPLFAELGTSGGDGLEDPAKKRRGRTKKSLEEAVANLGSVRQQQEAAAAAAAAQQQPPPFRPSMGNNTHPTDLSVQDSNIEIATPPQPFSQSQPTPSVITRMLQSKPGQGSYPIGTIRPKQFATFPEREDDVHHSPYVQGPGIRPPPISSPYRAMPPNMNHYPRGAPPPQIRNPVPGIYHTHRPMDPSPSGGGIADHHNSPGRVVSPASGSPGGKNDTPPPPYSRPPPTRFPPMSAAPRHVQQMVPPPPPPRAANLSPYHPASASAAAAYHYGQFGQEDAMPPTVYQNSPYQEQQFEGQPNPSENSNSKGFDEESGGEFGGLVSYFSSQREDDLES